MNETNPGIIALYKIKGETPLQALLRLKRLNPAYEKIPLSYAGRLDPMAEGVLLVMVGDENKYRSKHLSYDKEYEIEILFGVDTDTHDILGMVKTCVSNKTRKDLIEEFLYKHKGVFWQQYPAYSSRTVNGIPLFVSARRDDLANVKIPSQQVAIYESRVDDLRAIDANDLRKFVMDSIKSVNGDFRQNLITESWQKVLTNSTAKFDVASIYIKCSSGTYMRALARDLGRELGTHAICLTIKRIKVGNYGLEQVQ